jgi:hypothetical protein
MKRAGKKIYRPDRQASSHSKGYAQEGIVGAKRRPEMHYENHKRALKRAQKARKGHLAADERVLEGYDLVYPEALPAEFDEAQHQTDNHSTKQKIP